MSPIVPQQFTNFQELPPNAVRLEKLDIIRYNSERILKWEPKSEVWPFRFGQHIIGGSTAVTCYTIDYVVRRIFVLGSYQPFMTLLPTLVVPSVCNMVAYGVLVGHNVMLGKGSTCKTCFTIRGATFHTLLSTCYPLFISPLCCYLLARQYHTYGGRFNRNQMELFKILKVPKFAKTVLASLFLGNYLIGGLLAYQQVECFNNVVLKKKPMGNDDDLEGFE